MSVLTQSLAPLTKAMLQALGKTGQLKQYHIIKHKNAGAQSGHLQGANSHVAGEVLMYLSG